MLMIAKGCRVIHDIFFIMYRKSDVPDRYARLGISLFATVMRVAMQHEISVEGIRRVGEYRRAQKGQKLAVFAATGLADRRIVIDDHLEVGLQSSLRSG